MPAAPDAGLSLLFLNVGGCAAERVAAAAAGFPGRDVCAFAETMLHRETCVDLSGVLPGCRQFHCVRPSSPGGRPHGGVSVFVREALCSSHGARVLCWEESGVVWIELPGSRLAVAVCYFSPAASRVYAQGFLRGSSVRVLLDAMAAYHDGDWRVSCLGDFNVRVGALTEMWLPGCSSPAWCMPYVLVARDYCVCEWESTGGCDWVSPL
jgi:hypothetical protein